jgi:hypothetical protein
MEYSKWCQREVLFSFSAFQLFSFSVFSFSLQRLSVFSFQHFSFSAFQLFRTLPASLPKTGQKNNLIIFHFPLANFVSAGVIYPHRKKVGFGPGGLNPRKSKVLTGWTEWEYPDHDILKQVSRWTISLKEKTNEKVNDDTRGGPGRHSGDGGRDECECGRV